MLGLSNIRLIAYGVIALALAGLVAHDHWMSRRYKAEHEVSRQLNETLKTERINRKKADDSAKRYAARLANSRGPRSPPPVLMCKLAARKAAASPAPAGADVATPPDDGGVSEGVDIGPRLDVSFHACEENLIKLEELQRWVRERE